MEVIIPKLEESGHDLNWYGGLLEMKVCDSVMFQYVPIGHGSPHVPKSHLKFLAIQLFINQDCWSSPYSGWSLWIPIWCLVLGCSFPHNDGWLVAWTPLKNMSSSVGMIIPNIWKHKKCSKPPTRWCLYETNTHTHTHTADPGFWAPVHNQQSFPYELRQIYDALYVLLNPNGQMLPQGVNFKHFPWKRCLLMPIEGTAFNQFNPKEKRKTQQQTLLIFLKYHHFMLIEPILLMN